MNAEELLTQMVKWNRLNADLEKRLQDQVAELQKDARDDQYDRIRDLVGTEKADDIMDIISTVKDILDAAIVKATNECFSLKAKSDEKYEELKKQAETLIIERSASVRVPGIMAVYTAGRVTWDSKYLDGYAAGHPEIVTARKVGKPSVSYRLDKE
jgi:hypothetical protein